MEAKTSISYSSSSYFLEDLCHCCVDVHVTVCHGHTVTLQNV